VRPREEGEGEKRGMSFAVCGDFLFFVFAWRVAVWDA
jgi:hypothetical protein